jgi:dihydrofolate reductase
MSIVIIAAVGVGNHVIGANNDLPWGKIPRDREHFRDITTGHPVVMGRKTWDSLPEAHRPLHGRENIVLTRNAFSVKANKGQVIIFENIDGILEIAKNKKVFVIGGAEIYRLFMPYAKTLILTFVHHEFKGDAHFPEISLDHWFESAPRMTARNTEDPYCLTFCNFTRKRTQKP